MYVLQSNTYNYNKIMTRVVVPISMPKSLDLKIEMRFRKIGYASKSEYIRDLAREDLDRAEEETERKKYPEFYAKLDRDLEESIKQYRQGKYYGPFETAKEGIKFIRSRCLRNPKQASRK